jgi:Zn-dependent peptidase ImmA (M78 family)
MKPKGMFKGLQQNNNNSNNNNKDMILELENNDIAPKILVPKSSFQYDYD